MSLSLEPNVSVTLAQKIVRASSCAKCGDIVEGTVAHDEPLIWGFQQHDETATLWPL